MVKKIPDKNAKKQASLLGLSTIDVDIKSNPLAFNVLKNFVANMILEQVEGKSGKINYERIISEIVNHIMTFCIGYKAAHSNLTKRHRKDGYWRTADYRPASSSYPVKNCSEGYDI